MTSWIGDSLGVLVRQGAARASMDVLRNLGMVVPSGGATNELLEPRKCTRMNRRSKIEGRFRNVNVCVEPLEDGRMGGWTRAIWERPDIHLLCSV